MTEAPKIDWFALAPLVTLVMGACVVLLVGLTRSATARRTFVPLASLASLTIAGGFSIAAWGDNVAIISESLRMDDVALFISLVCYGAAMIGVLFAWRGLAPREAGHGEFFSLLLFAVAGMIVLTAANNLVAVFIGYELLSIPLYILCAAELRRERSLESGLKYLIVGSIGSALLLYGLALIYGATGATNFQTIASKAGDVWGDGLLLAGVGLTVAGLAFKASVAPLHQWTPDVYEGAPTPVTAFMAVATKAAAFGVIVRIFDVALIDISVTWAPILAVLATITILVGNVGAIGQSSLKRILAYSGVAQAGYMLAGVVVTTAFGIEAMLFYLAAYLFMNAAAFAVIIARERETDHGDDIESLYGIGYSRPLLAWPLTIAMLALAGFPATAGFFGKIGLIGAASGNGYTWLGVVIVIGSAISLAYYLRVVAAIWRRDEEPLAELEPAPALPAIAGGSPEADRSDFAPSADKNRVARHDAASSAAQSASQPELVAVAVLCALATIALGVFPGPLYDLASSAASVFNLF